MSLQTVVRAEPVGDARAKITFADGFVRELDLGPALRGPIFESLRDPRVFRAMTIAFDTICWPNGADISPDTLRLWCERGAVLSDEATGELFPAEPTARVAEEP